MRHLKLTLLLTVALLSLCPRVAHATQTISGTVDVSTLTDTRIALSGNVTLTVNQDYYLREIIGNNSKLTLILYGNYTLTVDQDKKNMGSIEVASLEIRGTGNLLCTGRNYGAYISGGEFKINNYTGTATFQGRDGSWANGVWMKDGVTANISSGTVEFETTYGYGLGGNGQVTISGSNTVVNISSRQDGINLDDAGNNGTFTMNGGTLTVYGQRHAIYCTTLTMNSGSHLSASNGNSNSAVYTGFFYATECNVAATGVGNGIDCYVLVAQDAYIYAYGGTKAHGIYGRTKPAGEMGLDGYLVFRGNSANSRVYADGDYSGIHGEADISIENRYLYAKARRSNCRAVEAMNDLKIYMAENGYYEAYSPNSPFYADNEIYMARPFNDRFSGNPNVAYSQNYYDISSNKKYFMTYAGSGASTNIVQATGVVRLTRPDLRESGANMSETLQAQYNGYWQTRPAAAYKGEQVRFVEPQALIDYATHHPVNNASGIFPNPAAVRTVTWQRSNGSGWSFVANGDTYTPKAADVGYKLRARITYSTHDYYVYSNELSVMAKQNTNEPNRPTLQISTPSGSSTRYVYVSAYPAQEYIVLTTYKAVDALTEADWADAKSRSSVGLLMLCPANYDEVYYVYTRFKETDTYAPGTQVLYSSISGGTSVNYTGFTMTATPMNGATLIPDEMGYCCLKNTVVKLTLSPQPSNATNFQGARGSSWMLSRPDNSGNDIWSNECGGLYANAACTQSLVADQYYTTVYAKLTGNRDQQYFGNAYVYASVVGGYYDRTYFVVANDNGTWDPFKLDLVAPDENNRLRIMKGCAVVQPFHVKPAIADLSNLTVEFYRYFGSLNNPTPPTVTLDTQNMTYSISAYDEVIADDDGGYLFYFKDGNRNVALMYIIIEKRPVEGVAITPGEVTLDPADGQMQVQLQASIYPEYAEGDVVWTSSNPNYLSVDENGLVTLLNTSATLGETYYITAQVEDFTDTCAVHVSGEKYDLWITGTRVTSLNKDDILGNGRVSYDYGKLTLNGGTLGSTTYTANIVIRSEMRTLVIDVAQNTSVLSRHSAATILSTGNLVFTGAGTLTVENRNTSDNSIGLGAKNITIRDGAHVNVARASVATMASNGLGVIGENSELISVGRIASVTVKNLFIGVITEPAGAFWDFIHGYITIGGQPVTGTVVITSEPTEPDFIRGDVNNDTFVNISDVAALINYLLTNDSTGINLDGADCNQDENVNTSDMSSLIGFLLTGSW